MSDIRATRAKARELRSNPTDAERVLWHHLRKRQVGGHRFRRQHPIGPYIVDFFCLEKSLIAEVDGGQHAQRQGSDAERDSWLRSQGYGMLRFWNNQVLGEIEGVKESILEALNQDTSPPP